jgi:hypothetical protein
MKEKTRAYSTASCRHVGAEMVCAAGVSTRSCPSVAIQYTPPLRDRKGQCTDEQEKHEGCAEEVVQQSTRKN